MPVVDVGRDGVPDGLVAAVCDPTQEVQVQRTADGLDPLREHLGEDVDHGGHGKT